MTRAWLIAVLCMAAALGAAPVRAQQVSVTAGEHATFTRLVIDAPPGTGWTFTVDGSSQRLTVDPGTMTFDLSRLFARIPRTRLADAQADPGQLHLTVPCACDTRAWEERPGLIVIDISDASPQSATAANPDREPLRPPPAVRAPLDAARAAGVTLAQSHSQAQSVVDPPLQPPPAASSAAVAQSLAMPIARALSQGVLDPASSLASDTSALLLGDGAPPDELPANMRIATVTGRPTPDTAPPDPLIEACIGAEALDFLVDATPRAFGTAFGRLTQQLYGEFDQPDAAALLGLIELYLGHGFGAEARALVANNPDPVIGRELLLGMSDVLENRSSNSRMRLAHMITCGGPAAVMATLAGAAMPQIRDAADQIALSFSTFNAPLRAILGPDLARHLIDADALDAARIVAGSLQRSAWSSPEAESITQARLDSARGRSAEALSRLTYERDSDPAAIQARLDLALSTGTTVPLDDLAHAESLASTERASRIGTDLMASIIALYARSGAYDDGFAALDRLRAWGGQSLEVAEHREQLRNLLWGQIAQDGTDLALMRHILNREDWRDPPLTLDVRQRVAERLLALGLATQALALVPDTDTPQSAALVAQARLLLGHADGALEAMSVYGREAGQQVRAEALAAQGHNALAAEVFEAIDDRAAARSAAILAGDWSRLSRLADGTEAPTPYDLGEVGQILANPPGHLTTAQRTRPVGTATPLAVPDTAAGAPNTAAAPATAPAGNGDSTTAPPPGAASAASGPGETGTQPDPQSAPQTSALPDPQLATPPPAQTLDFDRLGLITRSSTLLQESERLRDALTPLLQPPLPAP